MGSGSGGYVDAKTHDQVVDPLGIFGKAGSDKAGRWTDPLGLMRKKPKTESAADRAARLEMERQANIARAQQRINTVFDNPAREGDIADFVSALRDYQLQDLDRQKADTDRDLRFAMARGGLTGGSVNRDTNKEFAEEYLRGRLNVENRAQGAGSQLRAQDQDARARLITLATAGLDATTAAQQAAAGLRSNLENARATGYGQQMGDQFATFGGFIKNRREEAARRQANRDANLSPYGG